MASLESVFFAGVVHLFFRYALYITPQSLLQTPGPRLPTIIVGLAVMDLIHDIPIIPLILRIMPRGANHLCECAVAIFLLEVAMLIFWQAIEHSTYVVIKALIIKYEFLSIDDYYARETLVIGVFTLPLSLAILAIALMATKHINKFCQRYLYPQTHVRLDLSNIEHFAKSTKRYQMKQLQEALERYNSTSGNPRNGPMWTSHFCNNT